MVKRTTKAYNERRDEILAAAYKLFMTYGYDDTSVESIIDTVGISKGTFYYYFTSKEELLDALAYTHAEQAFKVIDEQVFNNDLDALQRMLLYFEASRSWKLVNRKMLLPLIKMFFAPVNLVLRNKMIERNKEIARPTLTRIVKQGITEKVFTTKYPEDIVDMLFTVLCTMGSSYAELVIKAETDRSVVDAIYHQLVVYQDIFERILGAPQGSLPFVEKKYIEDFFGSEQ